MGVTIDLHAAVLGIPDALCNSVWLAGRTLRDEERQRQRQLHTADRRLVMDARVWSKAAVAVQRL